MSRRMNHRRHALGMTVVVGLAFMSSQAGTAQAASPGAAPSPGDDPVSIVVIGDSIPYNAEQDCPGCTSFVDSYARAIEEATGGPVAVSNMSRHDGATTADIDGQLSAGGLDSLIRDADVVIVSIGFNDQPPYAGPDRPCSAAALDTNQQAIEAAAATTTACVDEATEQVRATARSVLGQVRALAPDAAIGAITAYNAWTGWSDLDAMGTQTADSVTDVIVYALDAWRAALCAEAVAVEAVCIDLLEPFNGPDGRTPAGDLLAADYTHPSQLGNDRIRDVLLESGLYPIPAASPAG